MLVADQLALMAASWQAVRGANRWGGMTKCGGGADGATARGKSDSGGWSRACSSAAATTGVRRQLSMALAELGGALFVGFMFRRPADCSFCLLPQLTPPVTLCVPTLHTCRKDPGYKYEIFIRRLDTVVHNSRGQSSRSESVKLSARPVCCDR